MFALSATSVWSSHFCSTQATLTHSSGQRHHLRQVVGLSLTLHVSLTMPLTLLCSPESQGLDCGAALAAGMVTDATPIEAGLHVGPSSLFGAHPPPWRCGGQGYAWVCLQEEGKPTKQSRVLSVAPAKVNLGPPVALNV